MPIAPLASDAAIAVSSLHGAIASMNASPTITWELESGLIENRSLALDRLGQLVYAVETNDQFTVAFQGQTFPCAAFSARLRWFIENGIVNVAELSAAVTVLQEMATYYGLLEGQG